jgi:glutamate racemase
MDNRPIGVFDSGLGGLTAVRQLRRVLPGEDIVYFGDTGRVPYGSRGRETILQYARQDIRFLLSQKVKFILAACGTVSSTYPSAEAAALPVPYAGVVGATARAAAAATRNKKIGVIGTAATIRSQSYEIQLHDMLPGVTTYPKACPMFVPLVENGYVDDGDPVTELVIRQYLTELRDQGIDTLILGCTHYPLLKGMIGRFMGAGVTLIDPGQVTADATADALTALELRADRGCGTTRFFVSDSTEGFAASEALFLGQYGEGQVEQISIEAF